MNAYTFTTKKEAVEKVEELFLNEPSNIYNVYRVKASGLYVLRLEGRSNG